MESQTVLKTAGGKTLAGSTPVPSAIVGYRLYDSFERGAHLHPIEDVIEFWDEYIREDANGKQGRC